MAICTKLIHRASTLDAEYVAEHLQADDKQELDGLGWSDYKEALVLSVLSSDNPITFWNPDGMICGVAGVSRTDAHCGTIWMMTTENIRSYPKLFLKEARKWLASQTSYDLLHNIADPRNRLHMKLLHLLGFKRLGYQAVGPQRLTFVEFAKLNHVSPSSCCRGNHGRHQRDLVDCRLRTRAVESPRSDAGLS